MADDSCGTRRAYDRHIRRGEKPDAACRAANNTYKRERRDAPPVSRPDQHRADRDAVADQVLAGYAAGAGVLTLAEELGKSRAFIRRILTDADVTLRSTTAGRAEAVRYRQETQRAKLHRMLVQTFERDVQPGDTATPEKYAQLAVDALTATGLLPPNPTPPLPEDELIQRLLRRLTVGGDPTQKCRLNRMAATWTGTTVECRDPRCQDHNPTTPAEPQR